MKSDLRGFTLIEIMVSLVIFSIVLLPLTSLLVADSKFEKKYEQKQVALLVANNELEKAKRIFGKAKNNEYQVTMAGRVWNIELMVAEGERVRMPTTAHAPAGLPVPLLDTARTTMVIARQFVTVRVSRDIDTTVLAEFRVMRETYQ